MLLQFRKQRLVTTLLFCLCVVGASSTVLAQGPAGRKFTATPLSPSDQFSSTLPKDGAPDAQPSAARKGLVSVIVKLAAESLVNYRGGVSGLPATSPSVTGDANVDVTTPTSRQYISYIEAQQDAFVANAAQAIPGATLINRYSVVLGGVSLLVPPEQVDVLRGLPNVLAVFPDQLRQLDETQDRGPRFIGAPSFWNELGGQDSAGEGVIVGVLDSGVWPEHASFSDPDPAGKPYAAPPAPTSGTRACEFTGGVNPGAAFACNNKLIGADRFMTAYDTFVGLTSTEFTTARDDDGHGTHTATTAAGNGGVAASIFGASYGIVSGIAPRAHVIAYKVCGEQGCFTSDSVAAIQEAIRDGVNVINFSISGGENPYSDPVELAFLDAYGAGLFVAASAGNAGPTPETVAHRGPWVTTVAASSMDRSFDSTLTVRSSDGASLKLTGSSVMNGLSTPAPVVNAGAAPYNDPFCANATADGAFTGKVVICQRGGGVGRVLKSFNIKQRGAVGMILYNPTLQDLNTDNFYIPGLHIQNDAGAQLVAFLESRPGVTASFTQGVISKAKGDVMAAFSSRGGPSQTLGISKPDITAPGVQVLAGNTPAPAGAATGAQPAGELFQAIQGTSMSSPHIAGSAALVKALHPSWTPGQIKSSLMTTAKTSVYKEDGTTRATPFDHGSGRVDLRRADDPGITFDVPAADYITYADELYRVNHPSIYIPSMPGVVTLQRTLHSVIDKNRTWRASYKGTKDVKVTLTSRVTVPAGGDGTLSITIDARAVPQGETRHFNITLSSSGYTLHIPGTIVRGQAPLALDKTCAPATIPLYTTTTCTITVTNELFTPANVSLTDQVPSQLKLQPGSVVGGTQNGNTVAFSGTVAASAPPTIAVAPGSSPADYLPLSGFGIAPIGGVGDETIVNFNTPGFPYGGEIYTRIGVSSNGYAVIGGGTPADNTYINQSLPDPSPPNNVVAPFWTDLDPGTAGAVRIGTLTDGTDTWIVVEWEGVREFSQPKLASFQIWLGIAGNTAPGDDVSFAYGDIQGSGDGGLLTVGAENKFGNSGQNVYFNGTGTLPANGTELRVASTPGAVSKKVITYNAVGIKRGAWTNYAELTSDAFFGTSVASFKGEITR